MEVLPLFQNEPKRTTYITGFLSLRKMPPPIKSIFKIVERITDNMINTITCNFNHN